MTLPILTYQLETEETLIMRLRLELFVKSVPDSMDFYTRVLGFETISYQPDDYSVFRKGAIQIALQSQSELLGDHPLKPHNRPAGLGIEIVLEVEDVEAAYAQVKAEQWHIADTLAQRPWGLRDFRVLDPNGFYIRITELSSSEGE